MTTSRPVVGVYFTKPGFEDSPFDKEEWRTAYHDFGRQISALGGTLTLVRGMETFLGGNRFRGGWTFDGTSFRRIDGDIDVGVVFNKGEDFEGDSETNLVNDPELHALCEKDRTYRLFGELCPQSTIVESAAEFENAVWSLPGDRVVLKPPHLCGGEGIVIDAKQAILLGEMPEFPIIVQEFVDLSGGIPGIVEGLHDPRIVFVGDAYAYSMIRTPPRGSLLANVSMGGTYFTVPDAAVPPEAMTIAEAIDERLQHFPRRIYSIDMGLGADDRFRVLELNSPPGLFAVRGDPLMDRYHRLLAELLMNAAREGRMSSHGSPLATSLETAVRADASAS